MSSFTAVPPVPGYGAAKAGVVQLTKNLAVAWAKDRIRVNYLIPGWVFSEGELALHRAEGKVGQTMIRLGLGVIRGLSDAFPLGQ